MQDDAMQDDAMQDEAMQDQDVRDGGVSHQPAAGASVQSEKLFADSDSAQFEARWTEVQQHFVDDPQHAVEAADRLVTEVMQTLAQRFADQKTSLEQQWSSGEVETEDLRLALQGYRSFFHRILAA